MKTRIFLSALIAAVLMTSQRTAHSGQNSPASEPRFAQLEQRLEAVRQQLKIPAISCAIVKDQKVVWAKGFGYADLENKIPASEHTSYHLASLTKTFASTILMQLIQDGKVKLEDPVTKYGIALESEGVIRVKHLFSHTSEGNPGENYSYNGNRFGELDKVVQRAAGKSFADLLVTNILDPLDLKETAPNVTPVVHTNSPGEPGQKSEEELLAAVTGLFSAFNSNDADQVAKYLAPQQNAFRRPGGPLQRYVDINQLRNDLRAGVKLNLQLHDAEAAVYGDSGVSTCFYTQAVTLPDGRVRNDGTFRLSMFWNKQGGSWKLVHAHESAMTGSLTSARQQQRFDMVSKTLAQPYQLDSKFEIVKGQYPTHFSTSAGLMSSVLDMAKYDIAIDQNRFVTKATQQLAFTPMVSTKGETLPYGLGWFTQNYKGTRLIWHYGYWTCNSSLIIKVPDRNITFIAMANTDNLSRPTDLGAGDVTSSPVGLEFLKLFVFPDVFHEELPTIDWQASVEDLKSKLKRISDQPYASLFKKELLVQSRINASVGKAGDSARLFQVYGDLYTKGLPADLTSMKLIAELVRVGDDADQTVEFTLAQDQVVRAFAIGEGQSGQLFDYGWIEKADGTRVWEMKQPETQPAGGHGKNRMVDAYVTLQAGKYKLRYKSDDSHSFNKWNALPPDINFWGIALYAK